MNRLASLANAALLAASLYASSAGAAQAIGQVRFQHDESGNLKGISGISVPLEPPTNLSASPMPPNSIRLSWTGSAANLTSFLIERRAGQTGAYVQIAAVAASVTSYSDTGLAQNTAYYYRARAQGAGGYSGYSNEASATIPAATTPAAPTSLTSRAVYASQIDLAWSDNSNDEVAFTIDRKIGASGTYAQLTRAGAGTSAYSDTTGLASSTTYCHRVKANGTSGDSTYSNETCATTGQSWDPQAPSALTVSSTGMKLKVAWTNNATYGVAIERKTDTGAYAEVARVPFYIIRNGSPVYLLPEYSDGTVQPDILYVYRARAYSNAGTYTAFSNEAGAYQRTNAAPAGLTASRATSTEIDLKWANNVTDADGVAIERKVGASGAYTEIGRTERSPKGMPSRYFDLNAQPGVTTYYRVRAFCWAGGFTFYSNEAAAAP